MDFTRQALELVALNHDAVAMKSFYNNDKSELAAATGRLLRVFDDIDQLLKYDANDTQK